MSILEGSRSYDAFELLSSRRRRIAINILALHGVGVEVEANNLARLIYSIENNVRVLNLTSSQYESAYNGLIQTHLPKLADAGIVEYDDRIKNVTATEEITDLAWMSMQMETINGE